MRSPSSDPADPSPLYRASAPPEPESPPLEGSASADVVVVGAGFTGISTALHLAERGIRATVLEAKSIGWGASSRNFGQVVPYFKHDQEDVFHRFGPERGERLVAAAGNAPDLVFSLIERHGIDCAASRQGLIFAAHSPAGQKALERRTAFWRERGAPVEMHYAAEAEALVGGAHYPALSLDRRGGTINPLAYVRGLAGAAVAKGATVHGESPVLRLERDGSRWRLFLPRGELRADTVVLATNAYTDRGLWPGLRESLIPMRSYQNVTRPLGENVRRTILPQGQPLTDTRPLFSGVRLHPDGRLQASADGPAFSVGGAPWLAKLERRLRTIFPQLGALEWEHHWSGWVAMTYDLYPHLHTLAPGLWAGLGYSGRGIALATLMGQEIAARIAGADEQALAFPVTPLQPPAIAPIARPMVSCLLAYHRLGDAWRAMR
ncbi:MAG TPA: FAD-binding oxidoreductase [Stellaceae bacterium]|nr:FAD-binding oxidoreductase [Stellaceae bacterium]